MWLLDPLAAADSMRVCAGAFVHVPMPSLLRRLAVVAILVPPAAALLPVWSTRGAQQQRLCVAPRARSVPHACAEDALLSSYSDAEARGLQLAGEGEYERAIRMFELAQTLPGDGVDYVREKQGGMIGSATAPPNPRDWAQKRFATPEQKLIAQYNIACCYAKLGDAPRAMELLAEYVSQVGEPRNQINEMLVDDDLVSVRGPTGPPRARAAANPARAPLRMLALIGRRTTKGRAFARATSPHARL